MYRKAKRLLSALISRMLMPGGVIASGVSLWAGVMVLCGWIVYQTYTDSIHLAEQSSHNLLMVIDRDIERTVNSYNLSLQAVINGAQDRRVMSLPADLRNAALFDNSATAQYFGTIVLLDAQGRILADSSSVDASSMADLSGAKSYLMHKEDPRLDFRMSPPHPSRHRPGMTEITISRRVSAPDGSFAGVVIGTINVDYFRSLLDGIDFKLSGAASIFMTDGSLLAQAPYNQAMVGQNFRANPVFQALLKKRFAFLWGTNGIDGVKRLHVFGQVQNLPMIVDIAPSENDILANWKERSLLMFVVVLLFSLVVLPTSFLLAHELRQRRLLEIELRREAYVDSLTGLYNRGTFDRSLQKACALASRTGSPVSLLFLDLDKFKAYNDTYGHPAGDEVLKRVTSDASKSLQRSTDHFARYGGEEFVAILEGLDEAQAVALAEQIRASIASLKIAHAGSPTGFVTVSIGVASAKGGGALPKTLIGMADEALYDAKAAGKNCVKRFFRPQPWRAA